MKRVAVLASVMALVVALVAGCHSENQPTALQKSTQVEPSIATPPALSGNVIRVGDTLGFEGADFDAGLLSFWGWLPSVAEFCESGGEWEIVTWQIVLAPGGPANILINAPEVQVEIYRSPVYLFPVCPDVLSAEFVASGTAKLVFRLHTASASWSLHGTLHGPSGEVYNYSESGMVFITSEGPDWVVDRISLKLKAES